MVRGHFVNPFLDKIKIENPSKSDTLGCTTCKITKISIGLCPHVFGGGYVFGKVVVVVVKRIACTSPNVRRTQKERVIHIHVLSQTRDILIVLPFVCVCKIAVEK